MTRGLVALLITTALWASSFPVIKIVVGTTNALGYTWMRSTLAILGLLPYVIIRIIRGELTHMTALGGLIAGIAYALGLWLQGWGTALTAASNSAFITGLNVVFVHLYIVLAEKRYSPDLGAELLLAIIGLYLLTAPRGGFGPGDALVLAGSLAWAAQVILVSRHGGQDPFAFTFFEMLPAAVFIIPDALDNGIALPSGWQLLALAYLGLACSDAAFTLQAYGQRYVKPEIAAMIYLLEPVLAAILSWILLGETLQPGQILGAAAIITSAFLASRQTS